MASQSRAAKYARKRSIYPACRVFQPRRRPTEFVEPRERGIDVCLVEKLAAAEQFAVDREQADLSPLGLEALLRGPLADLGDDRSEVAHPMHGLDVDRSCRARCPTRNGCTPVGHRVRMTAPRRWSIVTQSGAAEGSSRRLNAALAPRDNRPRVRVGGSFAGEIPGVEFLEGGVDVVEVEHDASPRSGRRR